MLTVLDHQPMPKTGDVFRYVKNDKPYSLVTVIGLAMTANYGIDVAFTDYGWTLAQAPVIFTLPLDQFCRTREIPGYGGMRPTIEYVFKHEPERDDPTCPYIKRAETVEQRYINALLTIQEMTANDTSTAIYDVTTKALYPTDTDKFAAKLPLDDPRKI
jgi:hypothetical protein